MRKLPISCFIIAKNEADRIGRTIAAVRDWVDEVIVVESGSTDDTVAVAGESGARVINNDWPGFGQQKRFAEDQCRNDWVFNLDADEVATPALHKEIENLFASGSPPFAGYRVPIRLIYPGASKPRLWGRDHFYVRLYDRRVVRFRDSAVHDEVVTDGHPVGKLRGALHHYSMRSFEDMKNKLDERMWLSVEHAAANSEGRVAWRLLTEFPLTFLKYYVMRVHFTGGFKGLRYAAIQARYRFLRIFRMWRARRQGSGGRGGSVSRANAKSRVNVA
jgi:glycosyltransferase involved in cell wall biosynthesis